MHLAKMWAKKYVQRLDAATERRAIGFVSMQIHYTGQILLKQIPDSE
jgi:hypothetical protein